MPPTTNDLKKGSTANVTIKKSQKEKQSLASTHKEDRIEGKKSIHLNDASKNSGPQKLGAGAAKVGIRGKDPKKGRHVRRMPNYRALNRMEMSRTIIPMEEIVKLYATESEAKGLSRVDRVVRTLAGEERKNPLVIVAHAITLAIATTLDNSSQIASFDNHSSVRLLDNDVIDRVNIGLRFPPGSVIALTQINEASPFIYELFPNIVPPLSYGEFYSNEPAVEI
ncbi:hypothetical protein KIN20_004061 [Parelaphostrongylus tenuis]|uniref:Uncharacterized protein n=1 Tax=Parelaphostrongylus tenuis TaxID=148309 RepID=A0AAD5QE69_PARTN|nr:hypothetical protein KIN20_004061 [Parelaphostrongylus tenuis]